MPYYLGETMVINTETEKLGEIKDDECDICAYLGKTQIQKVRGSNHHALLLCKPCHLSMAAIER